MHAREKRSSSIHQNTDASFPNQETLTSHSSNPIHKGRTSTIKRSHKLPEYKGHPKHSNLNKMKSQRNIQKVEDQDKCSPNQTKEEGIGSLPDKEFRIMIVKMIQKFENKMELQVNSLETRIEKM